jgi:23S rRNA maturation mini-RNase III
MVNANYIRSHLLDNGHSKADKFAREIFKDLPKDTQQAILADLKNYTKTDTIPC